MRFRSKGGKRHRRSGAVLFAVLLAALMLAGAAGCGSETAGEAEEDQKPAWQQTVLYLGREMPGGGTVSDADFQGFLEQVVTKEFPQGMTVFDGYGQMQNDDGNIVKQSTKAVLLVHKRGDAVNASIGRVIDSYRERFGGPQVMHTTTPIDVEFFQSGTAE